MKWIFNVALMSGFLFSAPLWAAPKSSVSEIDMSAPPFWMSSYDEFKDLQPAQKNFYIEKLAPQLATIPSLKETKVKTLQAAAEWYKDWDSIRKRLYIYCSDKTSKPAQKKCGQIAEIRMQAFEMNANQKQENRDANLTDKINEQKEDKLDP